MNLEPQIPVSEPQPSADLPQFPLPPTENGKTGSDGGTALLFKPSGRKPTGKIAELPRAQRDIINKMLDDGATYDAVETEMTKHGVSLNGENISNWFQNGFQQYLQHQDYLAEMRLLRENASDLVHTQHGTRIIFPRFNHSTIERLFGILQSPRQICSDPPRRSNSQPRRYRGTWDISNNRLE